MNVWRGLFTKTFGGEKIEEMLEHTTLIDVRYLVALGETGGVVGDKPILTIRGVDVDFVWGGGSGSGGRDERATLYYITLDETGRPCRLHRCELWREKLEVRSVQ